MHSRPAATRKKRIWWESLQGHTNQRSTSKRDQRSIWCLNNQRANWDGTWEAVTHVWIKKVQETDGWMATHCYNPCLIFFFFCLLSLSRSFDRGYEGIDMWAGEKYPWCSYRLGWAAQTVFCRCQLCRSFPGFGVFKWCRPCPRRLVCPWSYREIATSNSSSLSKNV